MNEDLLTSQEERDAQRYADLERQLEARDVLGLRQAFQRGLEVQSFMQSMPGRVLITRAKLAFEEATDLLRNADPFDGKAVAEAQLACRVPAAVIEWLTEAVAEGANAAQNIIAADEAGS